MGAPARVRVPLVVEWPDTDAGGHYQNMVVLRWLQVGERELHERLGIVEQTFGSTPRVRVEADFTHRLYFADRVVLDFAVESVGRTSVRYTFTVTKYDGTLAARGAVVSVYLPAAGAERPEPWPDDVRRALLEAGELSA